MINLHGILLFYCKIVLFINLKNHATYRFFRRNFYEGSFERSS